ncbi:TusE/DsrC/DsvC family sulfur relay protein [Alteromonas lipolytica]|uniref:Sulfurtransferase n=1 Tax=Alteromonas lipolytica TaxID=1856405 RepID=A0A1E8FH52_9ALTE|nr:TusE/DsrC/DsvC family sulfur relay protein [Alteromonas lipolytica]OFI35249.1 sulfurtransferase TusE [Alteromonas lipolytica]
MSEADSSGSATGTQYSFEWNNQQFDTDKLGYLLDYQQWQQDMVPFLAAQEGIELTEAHWEVVLFVREFYLEYETSPAIRALVKAMAAKYGPEKGNSRYLQRLFPKGPAKQATKLAGLPKPKKCL